MSIKIAEKDASTMLTALNWLLPHKNIDSEGLFLIFTSIDPLSSRIVILIPSSRKIVQVTMLPLRQRCQQQEQRTCLHNVRITRQTANNQHQDVCENILTKGKADARTHVQLMDRKRCFHEERHELECHEVRIRAKQRDTADPRSTLLSLVLSLSLCE